MNEEEKILKFINEEYGNYDNYVRDLLDLYNKEKERNKDLKQIEQEHKEKNGRLREENKNLEKELEEKDMQHELELIGKEEFTKANMAEIIEHYYTANEDCIPISKLKEKMELLREDIQYSANPLSIDNSKFGIKVLQSLLEKE